MAFISWGPPRSKEPAMALVLAAFVASASAFSPATSFSPVAVPHRAAASPRMSAEGPISRRAAFAAIFAMPAAANAMAVSAQLSTNRGTLQMLWCHGCL